MRYQKHTFAETIPQWSSRECYVAVDGAFLSARAFIQPTFNVTLTSPQRPRVLTHSPVQLLGGREGTMQPLGGRQGAVAVRWQLDGRLVAIGKICGRQLAGSQGAIRPPKRLVCKESLCVN